MSLLSQIKVDSKSAKEGVRFSLDDYPNEDGTIPVFYIGSASKHNLEYLAKQRQFRLDLIKKGVLKQDGTVNLEAHDTAVDDVESLRDTMFVETNLLGWDNFQPNLVGKNEAFSKELAKEILLNPDWSELLEMLRDFSEDLANYRVQEREKSAKN